MKRVFAVVTRDMTEKTAVCVFPWEMKLLEHIHGQDVEETTIDRLCSIKGSVKVQKIKLPHDGSPDLKPEQAPGLRAQLEAMVLVSPDDNPANDPESEYGRLANKYGMDKDVKVPVVTRIYGEFTSGHFSNLLAEFADGVAAGGIEVVDEKPIDKMTVAELRDALKDRGIEYDAGATKGELQDILKGAVAA